VLANVKALNSQTFYDERMGGKQKAGEVCKEGTMSGSLHANRGI
jgi:hypothetical protein